MSGDQYDNTPVMQEVLKSIKTADLQWYVVPDLRDFPSVSIDVDENSEITMINNNVYSPEVGKMVLSELAIPDDAVYELMEKCANVFQFVVDYYNLPACMKQIEKVTILGKIIDIYTEVPNSNDTPPDAHGFVVTDMFLDDDEMQAVDLNVIRELICENTYLDFMPVLFAGTRKECIHYVDAKLAHEKSYIVTPVIPQYHYSTNERIGIHLCGGGAPLPHTPLGQGATPPGPPSGYVDKGCDNGNVKIVELD